jgi:signal transduction histidine kinase
MISSILYRVHAGMSYLRAHPRLWLVGILVVILPLLFLYSGQQFLEAGRANQERLQKDRIGLLHDAFATNVSLSADDVTRLQQQVDEIVALNPDITQFEIYTLLDSTFVALVSSDQTRVGSVLEDPTLLQNASLRNDESVIFEFYTNSGRTWQAYRTYHQTAGTPYFIFTNHDLSVVDQLLADREREAYSSLILVYAVLLLFAYWHIRNTDYGHLYKKAKEANQTRDLFTNMIAHELRAPLTAIRGYASLLEESPTLPRQAKEQATRISQSSERLLTIVNDLLDVARLQSGKLAITLTPVALAPTIRQAVAEQTVSATKKGLTLAAPQLPNVTVAADQTRLQQALVNLLSNAIKYTENGTITVTVEAKKQRCEIRIKDTGMGIAAGEQAKLFAPFHRVESTAVSQITGTGLGMWITRQLIERMHGTVAVESIKGVGTHVVVTLPLAETTTK